MRHQRARYICLPTTGIARYLLPAAGLVAFVMAWFVLTDSKTINPNFLPGPEATAQAFVHMFTDAPKRVPDEVTGSLRAVQPGWDSLKHSSGVAGTLATVERITTAVFWACLIGIPLGILMGAFGRFESLFAFLVPPMRNAPITAFIPLFMVFYGIDEALKVNFLTFGTLVYIIPTTFDAIRGVPQAYVDRGVDLGFKPLGVLGFYVIPAALPRIFEGVGICTGIAWTYVVAAETVNVTTGLGAVIANAGRVQNTPKVYAGILLILILGVLTAYLFKLGQKLSILKPEGNS